MFLKAEQILKGIANEIDSFLDVVDISKILSEELKDDEKVILNQE